MTNKRLIYLAGPTGVGKTDISITLAEKLKQSGKVRADIAEKLLAEIRK